MRLEKTLMRATKKKMISEDYRPTEDEPFMNERQREYFRRKLLTWKDEILRESRETLSAPAGRERPPSRSRRPRLVRDRARARTSHPRPPAQADRQDRRRARRASRTAPTAIARRPASRSASSGSTPARSPPCRSRRRSATSGASASIATSSRSFGATSVSGNIQFETFVLIFDTDFRRYDGHLVGWRGAIGKSKIVSG